MNSGRRYEPEKATDQKGEHNTVNFVLRSDMFFIESVSPITTARRRHRAIGGIRKDCVLARTT
jgi:hypothetical protein